MEPGTGARGVCPDRWVTWPRVWQERYRLGWRPGRSGRVGWETEPSLAAAVDLLTGMAGPQFLLAAPAPGADQAVPEP